MSYSAKILISAIILVFISGAGVVFAQEEVQTLDVQPEDLGIEEPNLLPDSPFYFLKNWARKIQEFFTFNPVKKAELILKFANEKLMEAKKVAEKTQNSKIIKKAAENYQQEIEKIRNRVEEIKEKAEDSPEVDKFLDKFVEQQTLNQKILQKLESQVPSEVIEKIKEVKKKNSEKFEEVVMKLENREEKLKEIKEKIKEGVEESEEKPAACAQVITYCLDPETGECTAYPDACSTPKPCQSCSVTGCAKEGEMFSQVYEEYPNHCCEGLTEWYSGFDTRIVKNGKCVETGLLAGAPVGTCLKCGDGICGLNETLCNCPEDCE